MLFPYFATPAEDVNMLKGICVNGFYSVSLVLAISSDLLGWGQAALFVCSFFLADEWRVYHWWCHLRSSHDSWCPLCA